MSVSAHVKARETAAADYLTALQVLLEHPKAAGLGGLKIELVDGRTIHVFLVQEPMLVAQIKAVIERTTKRKEVTDDDTDR